MQPIKIRLRHGVETAIMCQIKPHQDMGLVRLTAMDKTVPIFALMFDKDGHLLQANAAATEKYCALTLGGSTFSTFACNHCP